MNISEEDEEKVFINEILNELNNIYFFWEFAHTISFNTFFNQQSFEGDARRY